MPTHPLNVEKLVAVLRDHFPVEDIWFLDAREARDCELERPHNLIVIVSDEVEAHKVEAEAIPLVQKLDAEFDVFVFPQAALDRVPRPLLVKMALSSGHWLFRK